MVDRPLSAIFYRAHERDIEAPGDGALESALSVRVAAGRAAWPDIALDVPTFVSHLATHCLGEELPPVDRAPDLWLACACALGVEGAAAALDRRYRRIVERVVARVDRSVVDEATQSVFAWLLVRENEAPAPIVGYGGRASLSTWLATVAARTAHKMRRRRTPTAPLAGSPLAEAMFGEDPDLALARATYAPEIESAFRQALGSLEARQRALLRLHHLDGWTLQRVAALYKISRATAARWLAAARAELFAGTKRILRTNLHLTSTEVASLAALLTSVLDVSLGRLLDGLPKDVSTDPATPFEPLRSSRG